MKNKVLKAIFLLSAVLGIFFACSLPAYAKVRIKIKGANLGPGVYLLIFGFIAVITIIIALANKKKINKKNPYNNINLYKNKNDPLNNNTFGSDNYGNQNNSFGSDNYGNQNNSFGGNTYGNQNSSFGGNTYGNQNSSFGGNTYGNQNSSFDSNTYNNDFNFSDSSYSSSGGFAENDDSFGSFQGTGSGKLFEDITDGSFNGGVGFADDDFSSKN